MKASGFNILRRKEGLSFYTAGFYKDKKVREAESDDEFEGTPPQLNIE